MERREHLAQEADSSGWGLGIVIYFYQIAFILTASNVVYFDSKARGFVAFLTGNSVLDTKCSRASADLLIFSGLGVSSTRMTRTELS